MGRIQLVTFDLDNTLWDVDSVIREAERVMRAWLAARVPEMANLTTENYLEQRKAALDARPDLAHDVTRLRADVLKRALLLARVPKTDAHRLSMEALDVFLHERHKVKYFDGALDMLEGLAKRYTLGALTNGNADIKRLGLSRYFGFGITAADVGVSKPDPAMFRAALRHADVGATAAVHVGDHPIDDIRGAAQIGMHTIWVNFRRANFVDEVHPTFEAHDLPDVALRVAELDQTAA